jgi:DNA processing protein
MHTLQMTTAELTAWLALAGANGLTPAALRALLDAFGAPQAVRAESFDSLAAIAGEQAARAVLAPPAAGFDESVTRLAAWCSETGNALVSLDDPAYPPTLRTMHDPPPLLYVKGRLELLHAPGVAIVGSRNATPQGLEDAEHFAQTLAGAGLTVISGLALGIDGAAHRGALDGRGGTVAVIGTGADIVYPAGHRALAHALAARGAIVSEWPLGTPARREHFPQRNRLIAALARGVLIVEAALRSGSLITARLANEMGREVFAVPGSIHAPLSRGCHQLIKEGAKLTETPEDIFEELGIAPAPASAPNAPASASAASVTVPACPLDPPHVDVCAARVLDALGHAPATLEVLAARTDMPSAALQGKLLELELAGHISALPGGRFARTVRQPR